MTPLFRGLVQSTVFVGEIHRSLRGNGGIHHLPPGIFTGIKPRFCLLAGVLVQGAQSQASLLYLDKPKLSIPPPQVLNAHPVVSLGALPRQFIQIIHKAPVFIINGDAFALDVFSVFPQDLVADVQVPLFIGGQALGIVKALALLASGKSAEILVLLIEHQNTGAAFGDDILFPIRAKQHRRRIADIDRIRPGIGLERAPPRRQHQ